MASPENTNRLAEYAVLGLLLLAGLTGSAYLLAQGARAVKLLERTVEVKGLAEREVAANVAIWPISFNLADNDLARLYSDIQQKSALIVEFLRASGFGDAEISVAPPAVVDKLAREYGNPNDGSRFRYSARATVTVYTDKVEAVRGAMSRLVELGRQGIALTSDEYATQFLFTDLNRIKPEMIEEATRNAREAAGKFAKDSASPLGKIRRANQGQFTIENRDSSTPHIKKIRVVSTVEYYLSD